MIDEVALDLYRGGTPYLRVLDGNPISLNITRLSNRKRRDAWGRYSNFYLAYTLPEYRKQGHATALCRWIQETLASEGYDRMKSLAGSWAGFRLHLALGDIFWGKAENGCLVVDSPLHSGSFPSTIPRLIRTYSLDGSYTRENLIEDLCDPNGHFLQNRNLVEEVLTHHDLLLGREWGAERYAAGNTRPVSEIA